MHDCAGMDAGLRLWFSDKEVAQRGQKPDAVGWREAVASELGFPVANSPAITAAALRFQGWAQMLFVVHENQIARAGRLDARDARQLHTFVSEHAGLHKLGDLFDGSPPD